MLKHLTILSILAVGLANSAWPQVPRNGSQQNQKTQHHADNAPRAKGSGISIQVDFSFPEQKKTAVQKPTGYPWSDLVAPANVPNWLLALVAGWAGLMALKTLRAIEKQADLMKQQIDIGANKERARIGIELGDIEINPLMARVEPVFVDWKIRLYGQTEAFVVDSQCFAGVESENILKSIKWAYGVMNGLPQTIAPDKREISGQVMVRFPVKPAFNEIKEQVLQRKLEIICTGFVEYDDIFGKRWRYKFKRKWQYLPLRGPEIIAIPTGGDWIPEGESEDNGEYPVTKAAPKPN